MAHTAGDDSPELERDVETSDLDRDERAEARKARRVRFFWQRRRVDPADRDAILGQLFFEGQRRRGYLYRFSLLQATSVVIAVMGVLAGSPATVIGAMLLAPLMTPVLALAAALVMVWPRRAFRASLFLVAATVGSVALAWIVAYLVPHAAGAVLSGELLARTHPSLLDLVVALAAGVAAGYATVREEVGVALPGVAVAVALVPPLAVVGISLELGRSDLAVGAALLFLVNLASIVLASGIVFVATGFIPAVRITRLSGRVGLTVILSVVAVSALAVPLTRGLQDAVRIQRTTDAALAEVEDWLGDRLIETVGIVVDEETVIVDLIAEEPPPSATELGIRLEQRLGRPVLVTVRWVEGHVDIHAPSVP